MSPCRPPLAAPLLAALSLAALLLTPLPLWGAMEQRYIFFPERRLVATPERYGLPFADLHFTADDGVPLHGWLIPGVAGAPLVLFCHGNAGNISHRLDNLRLFHRLGVSVFIFDYRGYGRSGGTPSEEGTYRDARAALALLQARGWERERMVYFGRSLGGAVALQLGLEAPPAALVMESPFTSIAAMCRHHNLLLYLLLGWLLEARYDSLSKIGELSAPLLIVHGKRDAIVPESMARRLFEAAREPKAFHSIPGAGHNDTVERGGTAYWEAWRAFLGRHTGWAP